MNEYHKDDPTTICALFGSIADRYDKTNAVLSLGMHWRWNRSLVKKTLSKAPEGPLLDLCCGTGEIAWTYLKDVQQRQEVHLIDFCPEMLTIAKQRATALQLLNRHSLTFTQGDAQAIPLPPNSVTAATVAYGIRNVYKPEECLSELKRVLAPGGHLGILELTRPRQKLLRWGHSFYLRNVLPLLGKLCTSNYSAYSYLSGSIDTFVEPEMLISTMQRIGFVDTRAVPLFGGIAHLLLARAPVSSN